MAKKAKAIPEPKPVLQLSIPSTTRTYSKIGSLSNPKFLECLVRVPEDLVRTSIGRN